MDDVEDVEVDAEVVELVETRLESMLPCRCRRCGCSWTFGATGPGCSPSALATAGKLSRPYHGQLRQLGAQSEYPGRHDPRVKMVDMVKEPTNKNIINMNVKKMPWQQRRREIMAREQKGAVM